ncbi:MAG: helical backbone metal receptor [Candidatus Stygibacter frigidus]|nr:helical backbone metal receptor [Candidatus Stygibacter frigidus]
MDRKILVLLLAATIILSCGKTVHKDNSDQKIVVTSPEVAEIIYNLQGSENIAGVTVECNYPAAMQSIPRVGTFGRIDIEKVVAMQPDIVFVSGLEQNFMAAELQKLSIRVEKIYPASLDEMVLTVRHIAGIINEEQAGKELADSLNAQIAEYRNSIPEVRPRLYVEIYGDPIMSVADSSFVGELVALAGFDNIFAELPRDYSRVPAEDVLAKDPEYILLLYPGITIDQVQARKGWGNISAIQRNQIITAEDINPDLLLRASPRCLEGVKLLRNWLEGHDD